MRRHQLYQPWRVFARLCVAAMACGFLFPACNGGDKKKLNRRISLRRNDDNPYGGRIAYDGLSWIFPDADISAASTSPQSLSTGGEGKKAVIAIGTYLDITPAEVTSLMNFVTDGNQVFISARHMSDTLLHTLGMRAVEQFDFFLNDQMDSLRLGIYSPRNGIYDDFSYPGDSYDTWLTKLDTQFTTVLGRNKRGHPNFVRISYKGGGAIYLHFAPLAFSNFFLLHKRNISYYQEALSYLSPNVKEVIWDDFFRYRRMNRSSFSAFQYIFKNDSLRWAFWLLLLLFALIYGFDSKRRQRIVPKIPPLQNTSLEFVRTIGRLYFQRRDNRNLAMKMAVHFQDQVRTRYRLTATKLDDEFVSRLAYRTGYPKERLEELAGYIQQLPSKGYVPDDELLGFHRQLEAFYKHI